MLQNLMTMKQTSVKPNAKLIGTGPAVTSMCFPVALDHASSNVRAVGATFAYYLSGVSAHAPCDLAAEGRASEWGLP